MFGTRLKTLRQDRSISQHKLAQLAGLHQSNISVIEAGRKNVTIRTLDKLAAAFGMTVGELLGERVLAENE